MKKIDEELRSAIINTCNSAKRNGSDWTRQEMLDYLNERNHSLGAILSVYSDDELWREICEIKKDLAIQYLNL